MQGAQLRKKKQDNLQLLLLYQRLIDLEQSCLTKVLRFEKSELFTAFQQQHSVPWLIHIRIDDFIYLVLLAIQETIFGVLPMSSSNPFTTPYRQSMALFFLGSCLAMISSHWFRWIALSIFCLGYPALIFATFNGYIYLLPVDSSLQITSYMGYLTLVPIFVLILLIYPLKQFIRNKAGAFYSYVYGLSVTLIFYLWPLYSFIDEISSSGTISFSFITNNRPLITAFIVVIVTAIYFFVHNALFQPKLERIQETLLQEFTQSELTAALEQIEELEIRQKSVIYRNFHCFVRIMSLLIFGITLAVQIFLYFKMVSNSSEMAKIGAIMAYVLIFQLLGAVLINIRTSAAVTLPISALISLGSALPSLAYYNTSVNFNTYVFVSISGPFLAVFWGLIKNISAKAIIFKINSIIVLFISIFLPFLALVINSYNFFTSDTSILNTINYILLGLIATTVVFLLILFIVWEISKYKIDSKGQEKTRVAVDYNYFQQGSPAYKYYEIQQKFSFGYLANIDLREIAYMAGMVFFVSSELLTVHAINLLNTDLAATTFYSPATRELIYSQFFIIFIFYLYSHCYLVNAEGNTVRYLFLGVFCLTAVGFLLAGFMAGVGSTTFKVMGGFSMVMIALSLALEAIRESAQKIFGFTSTIIVICLWIFIILPYVELIPFASLFADQSNFGKFIFGCILGTVILLIFLVGILTLIFNRFIDKFEEEKKFKFMMEDVMTLFEEEGIEAQDSQLHILYESFLYRDKKYVFFLRRGFPLNLLQDPEDKVTKLVTFEDYNLKRIPTRKELAEQGHEKSMLWSCLTFCCGEDDEQMVEKLDKAKKLIDKEELQSLLPKGLAEGLIKREKEEIKLKIKKNWKSPAKVYSSKSLVLKNLHTGPRYLGDEFILLKTTKNADLAVEIWHNIFDFAANADKGEPMIISNDFHTLLDIAKISLPTSEIDSIFFDLANKKWGEQTAMDLVGFSILVQKLANIFYSEHGEEAKFYLLIDTFFYNLSAYEEFNSFLVEKRTKHRVTKNEIRSSPFQKSYRKFRQFLDEKGEEQLQMVKKTKKYDNDKQVSLVAQKIVAKEEQQVDEEKGPSCKKIIFEKVKACEKCCRKQAVAQDFQRKLFVRPWTLVSIQTVKIMQRKQNQWDSVAQSKQHPFRPISNNILIAIFKVLDIYTYINFSISDPKIGWVGGLSSSNLLMDYKIQTYLAMGAVAISVPFGIKGIMLIFQDRLGLTQNRLPAAFPHPMFFFTFLYKLMILSLFNTVTQTFLDTFNCNWQATTLTYTLNDDPTIQCFSQYHTYIALASLICLVLYYPLSSYAMPNFQFAQKSLDLKYRPSYLIFYFQVQFVLLANKVLLSNANTSYTIEIVYISINIFAIALLALSVYCLKPCFIYWFNWVDFSIALIGVTVNCLGLALYLTGYWTVCVVLVSSICGTIVLFTIIFIKRSYFSTQVNDEKQITNENVKELEMMWQHKQRKDKILIRKKNMAFANIVAEQPAAEQIISFE